MSQIWWRRRESNGNYPSSFRNLLILHIARYAKNGTSAESGYTAGTFVLLIARFVRKGPKRTSGEGAYTRHWWLGEQMGNAIVTALRWQPQQEWQEVVTAL